MKRALAIAAICGVLVLDGLALDDITTGRQPTFVMEWMFLGISLPVLWGLVALTRKRG